MNPAFLWAIAGLALLTVEMFVPGMYMLWIGIAALFTAAVALIFPSMGAGLFVVFALGVVTTAVIGARAYAMLNHERSTVNELQYQLIGQRGVCIAVEPNNAVRIRINGVEWAARADGTINVGDDVVVIHFQSTEPVVRGA
jgi:membrane protein implicated in regulation of membrane protease activity